MTALNVSNICNEMIVIGLPPETETVKGVWYNGYPVHQGDSEKSLNYATYYASQNHIVPDQEVLRREWLNFIDTLLLAGFHLHLVPFPAELNLPDSLYHDAVFVRDAGLMYKDLWIKARFSVQTREHEGDYHSRLIEQKFKKTVITLPEDARLEGGDVHYVETRGGRYYFGGLSRSNRIGHDFVRSLIHPDHYILINSEGYHLDTVFTPIIGENNDLAGLIIAKEALQPESVKALEKLGVPVIEIDLMDSSGIGKDLGCYAVNALVAPGIMVNSSKFFTPGVEETLTEMGIERFITPLTYFRYAGGSVHCLTNEIYGGCNPHS